MPDQLPRPVSTRTVYAGKVVTLRIDEVPSRAGGTRSREVVEHVPGVAILAVDAEGRVLLVRQPRPAVGEVLLEIPAGMLDAGETPEACARRELEEETGCVAAEVDLLARFYASPGYCTEELFVFLATGLAEGDQRLDEGEEIEIVREPVDAVLERVRRGEIRDAKTLVGLLAYQQRRGRR
jgi:ADP-ribose pyrophosphatase